MATIDEQYAGKFLDKQWGTESREMMKDIRESIEEVASSGRSTGFEFKIKFTGDRETGEITPVLTYGSSIMPRKKTAASFSLAGSGQLTLFEAAEAHEENEDADDEPQGVEMGIQHGEEGDKKLVMV